MGILGGLAQGGAAGGFFGTSGLGGGGIAIAIAEAIYSLNDPGAPSSRVEPLLPRSR